MDWERTKTVFILAFLLLNAVFIYQLWLQPVFFDPSLYLSAQHIETKLTELQYKKIGVTAEIPRRLEHLRMLTLRAPGADPRTEAGTLLGNGMVQVPIPPNTTSDSRRFLSDRGEVIIYNDGRLLFTSKLKAGGPDLSESAAWTKAGEFLDRTVGKPGDAVPGRAFQLDDGAWLVEYRQRWDKQDLDISRINILIDSAGVLEMEFYWVDILGYTGEKIKTIPATGALTVVADSLPQGSVITDIYYSWYTNPVVAEQWRSYPVWVIETAEASKYYINAFTGDLEGSRNFRQENPARR